MTVSDEEQPVSGLRTKDARSNRLHLCFIFVCAALVFILVWLWQTQKRPDGIYNAMNSLWTVVNQQGQSRPDGPGGSVSLPEDAVAYDRLDDTRGERIIESITTLVADEQEENTPPTAATAATDSPNVWPDVQTFGSGFVLNDDAFTDLTGSGLQLDNGVLSGVLGTTIDTAEIEDGTIQGLDIAEGTLTIDALAQSSCTTGQLIKWGSSAWECSEDIDTDVDTDTTYSAGTGLMLSGTTFSLDDSLSWFASVDASQGTDPVADSSTDTLLLSNGGGIIVTGNASEDSIAFDLNIAPAGGLSLSGGALTLLETCSNQQYLTWSSGSSGWECASVAALPNVFQTVVGDSGSASAETVNDSMSLTGGNGLTTSADSSSDTVTIDMDLASGSGLVFSSGALTLQSCTDGQLLKRIAGSWACAADVDTIPASAYRQHLAGTDNITVGSGLTPLLTNGSGAAQRLGITIAAGNEVSITATVELSSSLASGPATYAIIRDDNQDNDCGVGGGDGTQIGGQVVSFVASVAQSFTTTLSFADSAPLSTTSSYQLCASTTIALGTATVTDRSLILREISL